MGRRKKESRPDNKSSIKGKKMVSANLKMVSANLNHSPQPVVRLSRLNLPECKENSFVVNVNSKQFKKLLPSVGTTKSKSKMKTLETAKPKINRKKQSLSGSDLLLSNETDSHEHVMEIAENVGGLFIDESCNTKIKSEDTDNNWSLELVYDDLEEENHVEGNPSEVVDDANNDSSSLASSVPSGNPTEIITRTDKVIDTFLNVLRKTTDDDSILSALQRDYICDLCQQGFLKKNTLRKHMLRCMGIKKNKRRIKRGSHSCQMCGKTYVSKDSLDKHNANIHNLKRLYKCLVCSQSFYNAEALTLHCRGRHGLGGSDIYKCPYCEASFNLRTELNHHCRLVHKTTEYYICPMCLECFKSEETCKLHQQSHGYCCEICMFKTKNESELIAHRSTHLYMVVHKCDRCSRTFKAKSYFSKHIKVHEREKKL